jgi:hypothetical protein
MIRSKVATSLGTDAPLARHLLNVSTISLRDLSKESKDLTRTKIHLLALREAWPYTAAQLLPHGPEETIRGYLDWLGCDDVNSVARVMDCLNSTVECTWPIVVPIMIKNDLLVGHFIHATLHWSTFYYNNCVGENRPITQPVDPVGISGILQ